jgi:FtsJ-like methyltransferase
MYHLRRCCPGGFSDYILCKNPQARGVGISLDTKYGGHGLAIPGPQCKRFEMHWIDLTYLAICSPRTRPAPTGAVALSPTPFDIRPRFQLIILDGVYREPSAQESSSTTHPWDMDRLLIAQFIIALEYINRGGTLLVKLSHLESVTTAQLVYMLDRFSTAIVIFKPYVNATRGSFYAVVTGVGLGWEWKRRASFLQNLRKVWWNLTYGEGPRSEGRYLKEEDLNFIVEFETLKGWYLERLIQLGRVSWRVQSQALRRTYDRIRSREAAHVSEPECDAPEI